MTLFEGGKAAGMAEIEVTRPTGYRVDGRRDYQVFVDRKKVGSIKSGEARRFGVPAGHHELQLKIDWGSSERLRVALNDDERATFVCAPRVKQNEDSIVMGFILAYWMLFGFRRYIDLQPGDHIRVEASSKSRWQGLIGPPLFGIALLIGVIYWASTGNSVVAVGVVVGAMAWVVGGLIGRGFGKAAVEVSEDVRSRKTSDQSGRAD
jgi:hypothetical protein